MTVRSPSPLLPSVLALLLAAGALTVPPHAEAAFPYHFQVDAPQGVIEVPPLVQKGIPITVTDLSQDSTNVVPGAPAGPNLVPHAIDFTVTAGFNDTDGWLLVPPGGFNTYAGQTQVGILYVQVLSTARNPYYQAVVNVSFTQPDQAKIYQTVTLLFFTKGIAGFNVPSGSLTTGLGARETAQAYVQVANFGSLPRAFDFAVTENECSLKVAPPASQVLRGHERKDIQFTVQGPDSRIDPLGAPYCRIKLDITAQDNPSQVRSQTVTVQLKPEVSLDPLAVFYFFAAVLLLILLLLFLRRRKERLEEEILGKPQKPWTIPVEQVYLRHLKSKDQRAWYVVRHYLMEDEYRSSLLWYKAYKKATRGDRKRERLVLAQEKSYARWKAGWEKELAKPLAKADRREAKLQRKLDRKARTAHRKATRTWRKQVRKLEAKQAKKVEREEKLHAKLLARARKKGLPEPEPLQVAPPDLPPEPTPQPLPLAEHRWARKAGRFRKRMLRRQGNLEVKFERADARKQLKLQRKVEKLSRDIGDADFVAQHSTHQ